MILFYELSPLVRAIFALFTLIVCLLNIFSTVLSISKKRYIFSIFSIFLLVLTYFMWQVIFDLTLSEKNGTMTLITQKLVSVGWIFWFIAIIILTFLSVLLFFDNVNYEKNFITPGAIKMFLDNIPCGICCYKDNGKILFSNICINNLCVALTDMPLLNGNQFYESLKDSIMCVDGKMWQFAHYNIVWGREHLEQIIASDITTEYAKTEALKKDKTELSRLNSELQEYTLRIDDIVHHQEILKAKVNIHDEMNKLMLSTMVADYNDVSALDDIFKLWQKNALLLFLETDEEKKKTLDNIKDLAKALKINFSVQTIPDFFDENQKCLLYSTAQEALANAAKHAKAKQMTVTFSVLNDEIWCNFTNDGIMPSKEIAFSGGLKNLVHFAKEQNAKIDVKVDNLFTLSLIFPTKNSSKE